MVALITTTLLSGCGSPAAESILDAPSAAAPREDPGPATPPPPSPEQLRREAAERWVDAASTRQLAGSVVMASLPSTDPELLHALMSEAALGGFILMGANIPGTPEELRALTAALTVDASMPPLVSIDQEGGVVSRLPWDDSPGADTLRQMPASATAAAFAARAELLAEVGANVNFGIVADFTGDPWSFIHWRSLGDDAAAAGERVAAAVAAEHGIVASTLKHFPGHGATHEDSHFMIPQTEIDLESWESDVATPFQSGIDAGAELLMFGHLAYLAVSPAPASLAPEWYEIARRRLGFDGVTITDDLAMLQDSGLAEYQDPAANAVAALLAGADIALIVSGMDYEGVVTLIDQVAAAVESGVLPKQRLREASLRVAELRLLLAERAAARA